MGMPVGLAVPGAGGQMGLPGHAPPGGLPGGPPVMQVVQLQGGGPLPVVQLPPGGAGPQHVVSLAPPPQQQQQQPPPAQAQAPAPAAAPGDPTAALLRQVLSMTDEQINALQPEHRAQVLYVKEQIRIGAVSLPGM